MKYFWTILRILFALFFIYAGIQHFINPSVFEAFVPNVLVYKTAIIYGSGLLEIILGVFLMLPKYAQKAAIGILILLLLFLPIHVLDIFSISPAIGNHQAALIRLPIQFILIALAAKLTKTN